MRGRSTSLHDSFKVNLARTLLSKRKQLLSAGRRRLRKHHGPLFRAAIKAKQLPSAKAASACFAAAEELRTESASERDLRLAMGLYRAAMHGGVRSLRGHALERLLLMLCQSGRLADQQGAAEVRRLLRAGGFVCRLTATVLRYPTVAPANIPKALLPPRGAACAIDGALPPAILRKLQRAFAPSSPFWREHGYRCGLQRSPFFSYVHALDGASAARTGFDRVLSRLLQHAKERGLVPRDSNVRFAEWWAHCRPHGVGHQLHFDSDAEGLDAAGRPCVRNPVTSRSKPTRR